MPKYSEELQKAVEDRKQRISKKIKFWRKSVNRSQSEMAMKIGVSLETYKSYESGRTEPNIEILIRIAELCNLPLIEDLICMYSTDDVFHLEHKEKPYESSLDDIMQKIRVTDAEVLKSNLLSIVPTFFELIRSINRSVHNNKSRFVQLND